MDKMFNVEESNLICIFAGEGRNEVIEDIERALPYLENADMLKLSKKVLKQLKGMIDEEFAALDFVAAE